jgi:signal transduction histidine kinase
MAGPVASARPEWWRQGALDALLTAEAVASPAVAFVWLVVRGRDLLDDLDVATALLVMALAPLVLRAMRRRASYQLRAWGAVFVPFAACLGLLVREGPLPTLALGLAMTVVMATVLFDRRTALALVALVALVTAAIAALVAQGTLHFPVEEVGLYRPRKWLQLALTFGLLLGALVSFVSYVVDHIRRQYRQLGDAYEQLGQLHRRLESGKEEERRGLARELHDDLGQGLLVLKLWMKKGDRPPAGEAAGVVDDLIARVRRLSLNLRPPLLDDCGVQRAVEAFLESQTAASGLRANLTVSGMDGDRLPADIEIVVFRVVQEAVTNVVRHAEAHSVAVDLRRDAQALTVTVIDDGRGLAPGAAARAAASGRHLGLVGIRERLRGYQGHLEIGPRGEGGTELVARLPLPCS